METISLKGVSNQASCHCTTIQAHSRNIAIFLIVMNLLGIFVQENSPSETVLNNENTDIVISGFVGLGMNVLLLYGTVTKNKRCVIAWLIYIMIEMVKSFTKLVLTATFASNISVNCFERGVEDLGAVKLDLKTEKKLLLFFCTTLRNSLK